MSVNLLDGAGDVPGKDQMSGMRAGSDVLCASRGYDTGVAQKAVSTGHADAIAFGRRFLATPDLVKRVELGKPLNQYHRETFYTQDQARILAPDTSLTGQPVSDAALVRWSPCRIRRAVQPALPAQLMLQHGPSGSEIARDECEVQCRACLIP